MRFALCLVVLCIAAPAAAQVTEAFHDRAIAFLDAIQPRSIAENVEYCGYFGLKDDGAFHATSPVAGGEDYCDFPAWPDGVEVIASYHTHSAHGEEHDSEVPSTDDIRADIEEGTFGYISTPGGRVWFVDWRKRRATLLCGLDCVASDPNFVPGVAGTIRESYGLWGLRLREAW